MALDNTKKIATKKSSAGQVQSLARGLAILTSLSEADSSLSLSQICEHVLLASSTVHRLLTSLEQQGFVAQDQHRGKWSIGVQAFNVGNGYLKTRDVAAIARPFMRDLMEQTGETSNLGLLDGATSVLIAQVECKEMMRMVATLGGRTPAHASGIGKALLSQQSDRQIKQLFKDENLTYLTDKTITKVVHLLTHLHDIKSRTYSIDDEEQSSGLRCIAANIYDEHSEAIAAISISGPRLRITDERVAKLGKCVVETAAAISEAIGGHQL
ncbi:MAG: helix-turn-helix domain-containing protein [Colwellia sp.]|nr:helix-turn-helix domain-containing protein [Colwellia sp.]